MQSCNNLSPCTGLRQAFWSSSLWCRYLMLLYGPKSSKPASWSQGPFATDVSEGIADDMGSWLAKTHLKSEVAQF
jgi:hypothetical protein